MNRYYPDNSTGYAGMTALDSRVSQIMKRVYFKMFLAMIVSGLTAWFCYTSPVVNAFFMTHSWTMWLIFGIELVLVMAISGMMRSIRASTATLLFYLFAVVNGVMLYPILMVYTHVSIAKTFFITAGVFGAMSVYGYVTSRDLTRIGNFLVMALFGLFIVMIVNWFLKSTTLEWIVSAVGVLIFIGLTAWDTQQVKRMAMTAPEGYVGRLATIGALNLYLDFINLFLFLLNFFGNSSND